ncbi:expressed unknown protein [Seminavis robusta]|uniref:Uncharacterized protein n=1 Tax=Seminavis robusta TaxID=568900 RepID=A0A9N8HM65_9STRA|nr:expressed unknown protein [Seminavis robusta]|eukprot:Sro871_g213840.1 n/a (376) ;mRNA; r:31099-32564
MKLTFVATLAFAVSSVTAQCPVPSGTVACTADINPVQCGADSCIYDNICLATSSGFVDTDCCPAPRDGVVCTAESNPVQCSDGNNAQCVYSSPCSGTAAGFMETQCCPIPDSSSVTTPCTSNVSPVECGPNNCPYYNQCLANAARWSETDCAAPVNNPCWYLQDCESCLSSPSGTCSWELGFYCTDKSCTSCVTPNYGGMGDDKAAICALPEAQKPADDISCPERADCLTCISSNVCVWAGGTSCTETCTSGVNCVGPNWGGLGYDKSAICDLAEAKPGAAVGCGNINDCEACLTAQCAWSRGTICTANCPNGDDGTCVGAAWGGLAIPDICKVPEAQTLAPRLSSTGESSAVSFQSAVLPLVGVAGIMMVAAAQ